MSTPGVFPIILLLQLSFSCASSRVPFITSQHTAEGRGRGRGEGELVHEEERIVAGSYFISPEDGGEQEARADDHPGNVDNVECVLDRERDHPGVSAAMPAARACRRWDPCYRRRRSCPGGFREDWNMHLMS